MVAVAQAFPAPPRRLVVVRTTPVTGRSPARVSAATYRRRRLAAAALVVGLLAAVLLAAALPASHSVTDRAGSAPAPVDVAGTVHVVQPGETFWEIARSLRPHEDPRPLVARLVAAHGSPSLMVGERILLPAGA